MSNRQSWANHSGPRRPDGAALLEVRESPAHVLDRYAQAICRRRKLIAGPTVFICDECVELCTDIIHKA